MTKEKLQQILDNNGLSVDLSDYDWDLESKGVDDESYARGKWDASREIAFAVLDYIYTCDELPDDMFNHTLETLHELIYNLI